MPPRAATNDEKALCSRRAAGVKSASRTTSSPIALRISPEKGGRASRGGALPKRAVNLFVYGTLASQDRVHALTGRRFRRLAAELAGYERVVPRRDYPYIVPNPRGKVRGHVLLGVDPVSLAALDRYEGEGVLYHRRRVAVRLGAETASCQAYVADPRLMRSRQDRKGR